MTSDVIFLVGENGRLERMPYRPYATEDVLQQLVASYPDLLAGDQIDPDDPPRWLLVTREAAIPDQDGGTSRWSADHLMLDHRGVPTFVEVKRSSDTRIRREIVGQMLDYAANATRYWPAERIRTLAADKLGGAEAVDLRVAELLGIGDPNAKDEIEAFWRTVEHNLRNGPIRLLFVADELPPELKRVIEFLNQHMHDIEVLGIELRHYEHQHLRALVPRVIGQSEMIRQDKSPRASIPKTSESEFFQQCPGWSHPVFASLIERALALGFGLSWATKGFSVRVPRPTGGLHSLIYAYPAGALERTTPSLELVLKDLDDVVNSAEIRRQLVGFGYIERGQYTLTLSLAESNIEQALASIATILAAYRPMQAVSV